MNTETELIKEFLRDFAASVIMNKDIKGAYHGTRIESNLTEQGIPDWNCCLSGHEFWIEFKVWPNELEPLQISWIKHRRDAGGTVFILTKKNIRGYERYLIDYSDKRDCVSIQSIGKVVQFIINAVTIKGE